MTLKELVDMKVTFEGLSGLKLIVTGISPNYDGFNSYFYNTCRNSYRKNMDFYITSTSADMIDLLYNKHEIVNKNSTKYSSSDYTFTLISERTDAILNVIGDVDINKNNKYVVFWKGETKRLTCVVCYRLMSLDKRKIIDDLVYKNYLKMIEIYNRENCT